MVKSYEFHDIFIKTCEYKDGSGECKKRRESKKCVDGVCENVSFPNNKLDVLEDYYKQIPKQIPEQKGEGNDDNNESDENNENNEKRRERRRRKRKNSVVQQLVKSIEKKYECPICHKFKYLSSKEKHMEKHERFRCPICYKYFNRFTITDHIEEHYKKDKKQDKDNDKRKDYSDFSSGGGGSSPKPTNKALYNYVKQLANKKFKSKSGIYRSSWIVKEYKKRGGRYSGKKTSSSGLKRWYKEKWVDLNRPIRNSKGKIIGYKSCGRSKVKGSKDKYPLCRPSRRVNKGSPRTYHKISKKSIQKAKKEKSRVKHKGNIKFGAGNQTGGYYGSPKLKYRLIKNLLLRHTCPICLEVVYTDMIEHIQQHTLPPKKRYLLLEEYSNKRQRGAGDISSCDMCQIGTGKTRSQYHGRKSKVMVKVPNNVKNVALYSFKLKKMGFGGGIETGWKRAKQLATKDSIPIEDLKYMRAWFARHLYASYPSYKQWKKAGRPKDSKWHRKHGIISWLIWGGDAAFKWVNSQKNINLLNKHYNKTYKSTKLR